MEVTSPSTKIEVNISRALRIEGWTSEEELRWLAEQTQGLPHSSRVVEVGVFLGRSAKALLDNLDWGSTLYCVDPYEDYEDEGVRAAVDSGTWSDVFQEAVSNLSQQHREGPATVFFREPSTRAALRFHDHTIDMIFIDGDHSYSSVLADITAWERTVKPGGLICGHDYNVHPGVKQAVDECFPFGRIKFPAGSIWAVRKPH